MIRKLLFSKSNEYPLRRWQARGLLLAVGLTALSVASASIRMGVAARLGATRKLPDLQEALRLNPENPGLHFRLGVVETYAMEDSDPAAGVQQFERAIELSPRATRYWEALASACELEGNEPCVSGAIDRALILSPMVPRIYWEAANYDLRANRETAARRQFKRLLEIDPGYGAATFRICCTDLSNPERVERELLTPASDPRLKLTFINFLASHGDEDFAYHVWQGVAASGTPLDFPLADRYLEHLIAEGRVRTAVAVWRDFERLGIIQAPADANPGNLIFNGSFERPLLNAGFGWRYHRQSYLNADFAAPRAFSGSHSLRLDFTVAKNEEYDPVDQIVPVDAAQQYWLAAYVSSDGITSNRGPRLRVVDPACPICLNVTSVTTTGTTPWHRVTLSFSTGPQTRLIRVSVERPTSRTFPMGIKGTFWLDDLLLLPAAYPTQKLTANFAH